MYLPIGLKAVWDVGRKLREEREAEKDGLLIASTTLIQHSRNLVFQTQLFPSS